MAIMYPATLDWVEFTASERIVFDALKTQLPDRIHVFFSVRWYSEGERINSECDFLVFDPDFGYLTLEVKGGVGIQKRGYNSWYLLLEGEGRERKLSRSPAKQAEQSMFFLRQEYQKAFFEPWSYTYGFGCVFPYYDIDERLDLDGPRDAIISYRDMNNLASRINEVFHYWSNARKTNVLRDSQKKFLSMINRTISLSMIKGAMLERQKRQFEVLNRIQDTYLDFIQNYHQGYMVGGAGTGKTWMALKMAHRLAEKGQEVLFLCYNISLRELVVELTRETSNITILTFGQLANRYLDPVVFDRLLKDKNNVLSGVYDELEAKHEFLPRFDAVLVDEGQDFTEEWALSTRLFMRDEVRSGLFVFYDKEQNLFGRDFKNAFSIDTQPFILRENLRNTRVIIEWIHEHTDFAKEMRANVLPGMEPERSSHRRNKDARKRVDDIITNLVIKEHVPLSSIVLLSNRTLDNSIFAGKKEVSNFIIMNDAHNNEANGILYKTVQGYKGLEADVVIFINHIPTDWVKNSYDMVNEYVAFTRAKFFLFVVEVEENS